MNTLKKIIRKIKNENIVMADPLESIVAPQAFPDGHFYSTTPSNEDLQFLQTKVTGIDYNEQNQHILLTKFIKHYGTSIVGLPDSSYNVDNPNYGPGDAFTLESVIRTIKPKKIIEIGSGFSSCVTLDTNRYFFKNKIDCTFIEPYPDLLKQLIQKNKNAKIIRDKIQKIDLNLFKKLDKNDILFIDSSHVSKAGSDLNHILFRILPNIKPGIWVHFHDIFEPFEYPLSWTKMGIFWNENYLLKAFLMFNSKFKIQFFNSYIYEKNRKTLSEKLPLVYKNIGGSIWLKRV